MTRAGKTGNRTASHTERGNDQYQTPPEILLALLGHLAVPNTVWEPACGAGNIVTILRGLDRRVLATDILPEPPCPGSRGGYNFLTDHQEALKGQAKPDMVLTNPPFRLMTDFAVTGLLVAPEVVLFGRLNFLEGGQRDPRRDAVLGPGGGLKGVYVLRERPAEMHRDDYEGPKASTQMTFAWFHWLRGFKGRASIRRISWRNPKPPLDPRSLKSSKQRDPNTRDMFEEIF